jgi:hypothetical protein
MLLIADVAEKVQLAELLKQFLARSQLKVT